MSYLVSGSPMLCPLLTPLPFGIDRLWVCPSVFFFLAPAPHTILKWLFLAKLRNSSALVLVRWLSLTAPAALYSIKSCFPLAFPVFYLSCSMSIGMYLSSASSSFPRKLFQIRLCALFPSQLLSTCLWDTLLGDTGSSFFTLATCSFASSFAAPLNHPTSQADGNTLTLRSSAPTLEPCSLCHVQRWQILLLSSGELIQKSFPSRLL